jgi:hypothetical protein
MASETILRGFVWTQSSRCPLLLELIRCDLSPSKTSRLQKVTALWISRLYEVDFLKPLQHLPVPPLHEANFLKLG